MTDMDSGQQKKPAKGFYLLPNMITTISMFLGFLAMVWATQGRFESACMAILVSALMDGLDGKVARLTHTASEFGVQYDSLADMVAFGLAPPVLLWHWQLYAFGRAGVAAAFIYTACGALRLARFNVNADLGCSRFFIGLPIPAAACTVVTVVFCAGIFPASLEEPTPWLAFALAVALGLLMISRVRYFSFKEYDFLLSHPMLCMVAFLFLLGLLASLPRIFGFAYCVIYIAGGLLYTFIILPRGRGGRSLGALSSQNK